MNKEQIEEVLDELHKLQNGEDACLDVVVMEPICDMAIKYLEMKPLEPKRKQCKLCPNEFYYGTGTGRRSTSKYCSDKCRKKAWQAK